MPPLPSSGQLNNYIAFINDSISFIRRLIKLTNHNQSAQINFS